MTDKPSNFIREWIDSDNESGRFDGRVQTRFPPEPNGYLHIGHAKAIVLNFGIAADYNAVCNLRFDDTNPAKEEQEYIDAIIEDIAWLGYEPDEIFYASDYFDNLYQMALKLIQDGKAYVDELSQDEIREYRGTLTEPGKNSPYRDRPIEESLNLFGKMAEGEVEEGKMVLRAKIDMASGNINMRDPVMYRVLNAHHPRTGNDWHIYPMYDFAHGQSDSIEGVTHSLCSLEYADHRPLYDWFLDELDIYHPQQIEFPRLAFTYTVLSKRRLRKLVEDGYVRGWDDPRMPTLAGLRRRGFPPEAIRNLIDEVGVTKSAGTVEWQLLEHHVRQVLNRTAPRMMAVLDPLKVVITNYPEGQSDSLEAVNNPEDESAGTRQVPFGREIYIERDDFMEEPVKKFFRLAPGREIRLRYAYFITCTDVIKDKDGNITELHATYDPATKGGSAPDGRKVKGTLHWVSAEHGIPAQARMYEHLFEAEDPTDVPDDGDFTDTINPQSLKVLDNIIVEPSLKDAELGVTYQFERKGYFTLDPDSSGEKLVFNLTIGLRDSWAKIQKKG